MKSLMRFIIIDDDLFALSLAKELIKQFNDQSEIRTFSSAREATNFIAQEYGVEENDITTILLTDLHMPDIDGLALVNNIENMDTHISKQLHIFVLSAAACAEEVEKVLSHACVKAFVNKPLSVEKLTQIITSTK